MNAHQKTIIDANIHDGLLKDHLAREVWRCVPADIDAAIERRKRQIAVLEGMRGAIDKEIAEMDREIGKHTGVIKP